MPRIIQSIKIAYIHITDATNHLRFEDCLHLLHRWCHESFEVWGLFTYTTQLMPRIIWGLMIVYLYTADATNHLRFEDCLHILHSWCHESFEVWGLFTYTQLMKRIIEGLSIVYIYTADATNHLRFENCLHIHSWCHESFEIWGLFTYTQMIPRIIWGIKMIQNSNIHRNGCYESFEIKRLFTYAKFMPRIIWDKKIVYIRTTIDATNHFRLLTNMLSYLLLVFGDTDEHVQSLGQSLVDDPHVVIHVWKDCFRFRWIVPPDVLVMPDHVWPVLLLHFDVPLQGLQHFGHL